MCVNIIMKTFLYILLFVSSSLFGQVQFIAGSYASASASSTGVPGLPILSYTAAAGTDRLLIFTLTYERDHSGAKGTNWANPKAVGGVDPSVSFGVSPMTRLRTLTYYQYSGGKSTGNATMSMEMLVFGMLEADIPAGLNNFIISGVNIPGHSGDDATVNAMMFEGVAGLNYLSSNGCENCNAIGLAGLDPQSADNMVLSIAAVGSDRNVTAGTGNTLIGATKVNNAGGGFTKFSEKDGIGVAAQYVAGTAAVQSPSFTFSGSADIFGVVEVGFRLIANNVLPVELLTFNLENSGKDNQLYWSIASEINTVRFEIERSDNGFYWTKIGEVAASGTAMTGSHYPFIDQEVSCTSCYYRLKIVDFDGTFEYSNVLQQSMVEEDSEMKVYPNPTRNHLYIENANTIEKISVIDVNGKVVLDINGDQKDQISLNIGMLSNGHYFLKVCSNEKIQTKRIVKI